MVLAMKAKFAVKWKIWFGSY